MTNILSIILIILSGFIFFFGIDPLYLGKRNIPKDKKTINDIGIKDLEKRKQILLNTGKDIKKIKEIHKKIANDFAIIQTDEKLYGKLVNMLPTEMEAAKLIYIIDKIQKRNNSYGLISDISLDKSEEKNKRKNNGAINIEEKKGYKSVKLSFNFVSDYKNFRNFLDNLYHSDRLIDVISVNATREVENKDENIIDKMMYNFVIRTYWLDK